MQQQNGIATNNKKYALDSKVCHLLMFDAVLSSIHISNEKKM